MRATGSRAASPGPLERSPQVLEGPQDEALVVGVVGRLGPLHWTYVGQIERGERNPTYRNLLRLASGLGVAASVMLEGLGARSD